MKKLAVLFVWVEVLWLLLPGCSDNKEITLLKGEYQGVESVFMRFPHRISSFGSEHIAVLDLATDSCFYHILSYPQLEYAYSIERRGEGPTETILPTPFYATGNELWTLDGSRTILRNYTLEQKDTILSTFKLQLPLNVDFVMKNSSTVILEDMSGENRFISIDLNTGNMQGMYSIPNDMVENTKDDAYLWRSFMAYNPQLDKVALASQNGDVLEIYSFNGEDPIIITGEEGKPQKDKEGFHDVKWHDNCIWALYSGRSREKIAAKKSQGEAVPDGGNLIKVYSQDGTLTHTYMLDCYINGFAIIDGKIVGITSNSDDLIITFAL